MKADVIREINGIDYRFRMSLQAGMDIEAKLGMPISKIGKDMSMDQINTIARQTIRSDEGAKIKEEEWSGIVDNLSFVDAAMIISEVMGVNMPKSKGGDTKNK